MRKIYYDQSFFKKVYNLRSMASLTIVGFVIVGFFLLILPSSVRRVDIFLLLLSGFVVLGIVVSYFSSKKYVGSIIEIKDSEIQWTLSNGKRSKIEYASILEAKFLRDRIFLIYREKGSVIKKTFSIFDMNTMADEEMKEIFNFIVSKKNTFE